MSECKIISNSRMHGDYFRAVFDAPEIAHKSCPGQFVHIRIDAFRLHALQALGGL